MSRILFISTYPVLAENVKKISNELDIAVDIHEGGILKDGHLYAKSMEYKYDVIVSQSVTSSTIRDLVNIPVLDIELSFANILSALLKANEYGNPIALIGYNSQQLEELIEFKKSISIDFQVFPYYSKEGLKNLMQEIQGYGDITLVCMGNCVQELASSINLKSVIIESSYSTIKKSLISAKNICDIGRKEKEKNEKLNTIINYSKEGIISVNEYGYIKSFNPVAEEMLGINKPDIIDHNINTLNIQSLNTLYGDGSEVLDTMTKVNNTNIILNRVMMTAKDENIGVLISFQNISDFEKKEHKIRSELYTKGLVSKYTYDDIIGESPILKSTINKASKYAKTSSTILIQGETGTGKEIFAQSIHSNSNRRKGPFVAINCAALSESLLESELFGYEEGAFTGAKKGGKPGLFELANNGTLFLDEVGEIPLRLQSRLLRVLQERELIRVGGDYVLNVDVRVISATNCNLYEEVMEGTFREDLYFRLNILNIELPPLRKRVEDIPLLVNFFINSLNHFHNTQIESISNTALQLLKLHHWPGNVRELKNFVEKLVILSEEPIIHEKLVRKILKEHNVNRDMSQPVNPDNANSISVNIDKLKNMELQIIEELDAKFDGDIKSMTDTLGISRTTLWKRLKELNIS